MNVDDLSHAELVAVAFQLIAERNARRAAVRYG